MREETLTTIPVTALLMQIKKVWGNHLLYIIMHMTNEPGKHIVRAAPQCELCVPYILALKIEFFFRSKLDPLLIQNVILASVIS